MNRPLRIGVSACVFHADPGRITFNGRPLLYLEQSMGDWLLAAGALPFLIPFPSAGREVTTSLKDLVEALDGLVLQGGVDMSPRSYGEEPIKPEWSGDPVRDAYEMELVRRCMDANRPVLGICRGHQVVNVALGGTLYQDINHQVPGSLVHRRADIYEKNEHEIVLTPGSRLQEIYGGIHDARINSVHHQAVKDVAHDLVVEARSREDDIIEAIRLVASSHHDPWVAGVQWHPEFQDPANTRLLSTQPILQDFFGAIRARRGADA